MLFGFEQQTTSPNMNTWCQTGMSDHESCVDTREARGANDRIKSKSKNRLFILFLRDYRIREKEIISMPGRETSIQYLTLNEKSGFTFI
jgi:hypothetical protein